MCFEKSSHLVYFSRKNANIYTCFINLFNLVCFASSLWSPALCLIYNFVTFLLVLSHLCAVLCDPGIVKFPAFNSNHKLSPREGLSNGPPGWSVCIKCSMYRPPRAHHCRICRRCIRKMDHHCPWLELCIILSCSLAILLLFCDLLYFYVGLTIVLVNSIKDISFNFSYTLVLHH